MTKKADGLESEQQMFCGGYQLIFYVVVFAFHYAIVRKLPKLLLLFFQFYYVLVGKLDRAYLPAFGFMVVLPSAIN